jgi:hypothetical protein
MATIAADQAFQTCLTRFQQWNDARAAHAEAATAYVHDRTDANRFALTEAARAVAEAARALCEARARFQAAATEANLAPAPATNRGPAR